MAVADGDGRALLDALRGVSAAENLLLTLELAGTAAHALEALHGDGWRDELNLAMLAASVEGVTDGAAEVG
ncbi:hypothetical protein OB08_14915 [Microbacterium sp. HJ5]